MSSHNLTTAAAHDSSATEICRLYIARPGPTEDNYVDSSNLAIGRWSHDDNTPLSSMGVQTAEGIGKMFKGVRFNYAYCSTAVRTIETAKIILGQSHNHGVTIYRSDNFYEMEIGPLAGKTDKEIIDFFYEQSQYQTLTNKQKQMAFPKLWEKRQGGPICGNDCLLDEWHADLDNFDDFNEEFLPALNATIQDHLGQTLLVVPHGTPMKAIIGKAWNVASHRIKCEKGAIVVAEIDKEGKITVTKQYGVSVEDPEMHTS